MRELAECYSHTPGGLGLQGLLLSLPVWDWVLESLRQQPCYQTSAW